MRVFLIISALLFQVNSDLICDVCMCNYNMKTNDDFQGENIDCSYNTDIFKYNYTLPVSVYSMDMSSSNITQIKTSIVLHSKTMVELYLNNNVISDISNDALQLPELKRLDLSNNQMEHIDAKAFKTLNKLEYLNLANNKFTTFAKMTFHHLSNLRTVILDNNNIGPSLQDENLFDRNGFGLTNKIKSLSISGINFNTVPDNFFVDVYDIRNLIISNNNITDVFELPFTLEYLDLSDNPIQEITSDDFTDLPALKELRLNNLAIKEVPEYVFASLHALVTLNLERNMNLTRFSKLAFGREVLDDPDDFILETLSIKGSRIKTLDKDLLEPFGQLIILDLQGNPWQCDCNLLWIKQLQIEEQYYDHVRCLTPKQLYNARIFELDPKYFACAPNKHHIGLAIATVAFCTILAVIGVWFFIFIPKYQSRNNCLQHMYTPSTAYSILPMSTALNDPTM